MAHVKTVVIKLSGIAAASAAILVSGAPAEAVTYTQTVGPVSYSMLGTNQANSNPPSLVFAPFNVQGVPASNLTAVRLSQTSTGTYGGTASLVNLNAGAGTTFSFSGTPTFRFSNNQTLVGDSVGGTLTPNSTGAGVGTVVNASVSGAYPGAKFLSSPVNSSVTVTPSLLTYFTSGSPTINFYRIDYAVTSGPTSGATDFSTATFSGQLYLTYEYDAVPAPTAIAGTAAAFAYTRRLKTQSKRIRALRNSVNA